MAITANERGRVGAKMDRIVRTINTLIEQCDETPNETITANELKELLINFRAVLKKEFAYTNKSANSHKKV